MRYRLRTLLILLAVGPPVIAGFCLDPFKAIAILLVVSRLFAGVLMVLGLVLTATAIFRRFRSG